jgi:hypothetical protein
VERNERKELEVIYSYGFLENVVHHCIYFILNGSHVEQKSRKGRVLSALLLLGGTGEVIEGGGLLPCWVEEFIGLSGL